jgi:hypothetical protein
VPRRLAAVGPDRFGPLVVLWKDLTKVDFRRLLEWSNRVLVFGDAEAGDAAEAESANSYRRCPSATQTGRLSGGGVVVVVRRTPSALGVPLRAGDRLRFWRPGRIAFQAPVTRGRSARTCSRGSLA